MLDNILIIVAIVLSIVVLVLSLSFFILYVKCQKKKNFSGNQRLLSLAALLIWRPYLIVADCLLFIEACILVYANIHMLRELKKTTVNSAEQKKSKAKPEPMLEPNVEQEQKVEPKIEPRVEPAVEPEPIIEKKVIITKHEATAEEEQFVAEHITQEVSIEEAQAKISDEIAAHFVDTEKTVGTEKKRYNKKAIVNVDTLSDNFRGGSKVTIKSLTEKGLVPKGTDYIKILARGTLKKRLKVEANDYSADAIKMIILTGGTVKKII